MRRERRENDPRLDRDTRLSFQYQLRDYYQGVCPQTQQTLIVKNPFAIPLETRCPHCNGLVQLDLFIGALVCVNCARAYYDDRVPLVRA